MNLTEAYTRALTISDEAIQQNDMLHSFNACQSENAELIYNLKKATITKASDVFTLPTDYVNYLNIMSPVVDQNTVILYGNTFEFYGWEDLDECDIVYNASLAVITTEGAAILPLPLHLHELYPLYAAKMYMVQDDESERYKIISGEYERVKTLLKRHYDKRRRLYSGGYSWLVTR